MLPLIFMATLLAEAPTVPAKPFEIVHGRLFVTNGTPSIRIWRIGTKQILGVHPDESPEALPDNIRKWVRFGVNVYADFTVEPVAPVQPGQMQLVRLVSASQIVIEQTDLPDGPKTFKLRSHAP